MTEYMLNGFTRKQNDKKAISMMNDDFKIIRHYENAFLFRHIKGEYWLEYVFDARQPYADRLRPYSKKEIPKHEEELKRYLIEQTFLNKPTKTSHKITIV